jgi:molybdopterin-guanine dinucleotide biosynthesis protein A
MFHPFEIAVCGYSGSGKTTLVARLIEHFAPMYRVGYIKHSGHDFDIDSKGKDTAKAREAGAIRVFITNGAKTALTTGETVDFVQQRTAFDDCDFVLAEGWRQGAIPKIVVLEDDEAVLNDLSDDENGPVLATVGGRRSARADLPHFDRDAIEEIAGFILAAFQERLASTPLHGLVLAGGKSTRMKKDKASLEYGGKTQLEHAFDLVANICAKSFISSREGQWEDGRFSALPQLHDQFAECGPTGGILTAMNTHRDAAWLVVACDLPYLEKETLADLIQRRNPFKAATAFTSANDGLPEPLCAIYEPRARSRLLQFMALGYTCPRKVLINSNVELLELDNSKALDNVNDPDEYKAAKANLSAAT